MNFLDKKHQINQNNLISLIIRMAIAVSVKKDRSAIYCECIMGVISSVLAIIGLVLVLTKTRLIRPWAFNISFTF